MWQPPPHDTLITNGQLPSAPQLLAAGASGAISGATFSVAGPLAYSVADGATARLLSGSITATGSAASQYVANALDPCDSTGTGGVLGAAALSGAGGAHQLPLFDPDIVPRTPYGPRTLLDDGPPQPLPGRVVGQSARFGRATSTDYRTTFFEAYLDAPETVIVHHAVEQQVLDLYPGQVTIAEIHSVENLRGIPGEINDSIHLSMIRRSWDSFYQLNPNATRAQLLEHATLIDDIFGHLFIPPVR